MGGGSVGSRAPKKDCEAFLGRGATRIKTTVWALAHKPEKNAVLRRGGGNNRARTCDLTHVKRAL